MLSKFYAIIGFVCLVMLVFSSIRDNEIGLYGWAVSSFVFFVGMGIAGKLEDIEKELVKR